MNHLPADSSVLMSLDTVTALHLNYLQQQLDVRVKAGIAEGVPGLQSKMARLREVLRLCQNGQVQEGIQHLLSKTHGTPDVTKTPDERQQIQMPDWLEVSVEQLTQLSEEERRWRTVYCDFLTHHKVVVWFTPQTLHRLERYMTLCQDKQWRTEGPTSVAEEGTTLTVFPSEKLGDAEWIWGRFWNRLYHTFPEPLLTALRFTPEQEERLRALGFHLYKYPLHTRVSYSDENVVETK